MKGFEKIRQFFKKEASQNKITVYLCLLGAIGLLLVFLSDGVFDFSSRKTDNKRIDPMLSSEQEIMLEKRLEAILSQIDGAGKTRVMLTFEGSEQFFYLTDTVERFSKNEQETETETEKKIAIAEKNSQEEPVLYQIQESEIRGVTVVCEGGNNAEVREKIISAVCAVLRVPSHCVCVAKMA